MKRSAARAAAKAAAEAEAQPESGGGGPILRGGWVEGLGPVAPDVVSVDPGDRHAGLAAFCRLSPPVGAAWAWDGGSGGPGGLPWVCVGAWETTPGGCLAYVRAWAQALRDSSRPGRLVVERFQLYASEAAEQVGSDMETAQLIGALRYCLAVEGWDGIEWQHPQANVKEATGKILARLGGKGLARQLGAGPHARDAEILGWHTILKDADQIRAGSV